MGRFVGYSCELEHGDCQFRTRVACFARLDVVKHAEFVFLTKLVRSILVAEITFLQSTSIACTVPTYVSMSDQALQAQDARLTLHARMETHA